MITTKPTGYTRQFSYWCAICPTRIRVEMEHKGEHVAPVICPSCGGELADLDDLLVRKAVSYPESPGDVPRLHREWLEGRTP